MRYRVKDYKITILSGDVFVHFPIPAGVSPTEGASTKPLKEAIRLIVDETACIVFCSSMQKGKITGIGESAETGCDWYVQFAIPSGKTVQTTDHFTIEMDWGENLTGIYEKIGDLEDIIESINGDTTTGIVSDYCAEMFDSIFTSNEDGTNTYTLTLPLDAEVEETPNGTVATI